MRHILGLASVLALAAACWLAWRSVQWLLSGTIVEELSLVAAAAGMLFVLCIAAILERELGAH